MLGLDITYWCTEFDQSSFSCSGDMVGAHRNLNGLRDLTTPLSGMICHPWARICLPNLEVYLRPLRRYEKVYKIWKMGWFGVVMGSLKVTENIVIR